MSEFVIDSDVLYPRDEAHRLRIYARRGDRLQVVAATDVDGLGRTLLQLDEDQRQHGERLSDLGAIGVLDAAAGHWLVLPWTRPDHGQHVGDHVIVERARSLRDAERDPRPYEDDETTGLAGRPDGNGEKW
jgi:hypothetical protein